MEDVKASSQSSCPALSIYEDIGAVESHERECCFILDIGSKIAKPVAFGMRVEAGVRVLGTQARRAMMGDLDNVFRQFFYLPNMEWTGAFLLELINVPKRSRELYRPE